MQQQDVRNMWFLTRATNASLAAFPWKMQVWKASPAIVKFNTESVWLVCARYSCPCEYMCVCVYLWWVPRSALIGDAIFFSPSLFCPQVRVWLLIPWAAVLLNLQHMIHNRSPVKLNHSLLWPLINIQWRTQSLSWSASSPIYSAFSCL